eukprot:12148596-Karenia_brevis.AAC.1
MLAPPPALSAVLATFPSACYDSPLPVSVVCRTIRKHHCPPAGLGAKHASLGSKYNAFCWQNLMESQDQSQCAK